MVRQCRQNRGWRMDIVQFPIKTRCLIRGEPSWDSLKAEYWEMFLESRIPSWIFLSLIHISKEIHCTVCDALVETQTIPATGAHDYEWKVVKEASCTEKGSKEGTCKVCHATTEEEIPVKAHTMGEWKVSKEPTCTEAGTEIRICSECKKYEETRELKALGHKWAVNDSTDKDGWKVVKEATKEEEGSKERVCSRLSLIHI